MAVLFARRDPEQALKNHLTFKPSEFFVFRTPLLPFQELLSWGEGLEAPAAVDDPAKLEQALDRDRVRLRERLYIIAMRPEVRDALFVASPNIIERFHLWTNDPTCGHGRKVEHALVRYFSRMTGRATPFGLFAGCSVGKITDQTRLEIQERAGYQRRTRLDMDYLVRLTDALGREPELRSLFVYQPNSSLYRVAGGLRYVESRFEEKKRSYHLVALEDSEYLDATLTLAKGGANFATLARALIGNEISLSEAEEYVAMLIESQILVPEISLPVTGPEPIHRLVNQLHSYEKTEFAGTLDRVRTTLAENDKTGIGAEAERYRSVIGMLESLPAEVDPARLFHVDMLKPAPEATLGGAALDEISRGVDVLHRLAQRPRRDSLARFRESFSARYEQREVPLVEALDEEVGVGFETSDETSPLLKGLVFPAAPDEISTEPVRHAFLLRKLSEALQRGSLEINLEQRELEAISLKDPLPLPDSFAVEATLAADSQLGLARGDFRVFLQGCAGPSGATLLGRFCHADETLHANVKSLLRAEEAFAANAVFAEIVHLPEGRIGNVIFRPVLRQYEIPYLARSGVATDKQIPVTDLYVSVQDDRIRLRSASTGREVIPRLTSAHNYSSGSLGVYRFLCTLQHQGTSVCPPWDWGALWSAPFLPRVTTGRLVLSLASWRVYKEELAALGGRKGADRFRAVQKWRVERKLPRYVALADADNVLPVDLDNALSVESFVQLVKERQEATLREVFPGPDQLCAYGPEGRFVHELIVPFVKSKDEGAGTQGRGDKETPGRGEVVTRGANEFPISASPRLPVSESSDPPVSTPILHPFPRRFPPGSEWLYAKLYTGTASADALLRDVVQPLVESLMQSHAADQWFFIRYADPEWHLRLRFHGEPEMLHRLVLPAVHAAFNPLLDDGKVWRVQFDTYERELERYGGPEGIVLAERLFHVDSEAALELIKILDPGDEGANERWRLALYGIDRLLADFALDLNGKYEVLKKVREVSAKEFRSDKSMTAQLSEKFRKERRSLEDLLDPGHEQDHPLAPGFAVLHDRSRRLAPIVAELKACEGAGRLSTSIQELLPSYIHMHANRLLRSAQRQQELVLYDFLARLYESQAGRATETRG